MKERPIILSATMVRAILEGRKTQTRRVVKFPLTSASDGVKRRIFTENNVQEINNLLSKRQRYPIMRGFCPYGQQGDRLWVRETWRIGAWRDDGARMAFDYRASPDLCRTPWVTIPADDYNETFNRYWYGVCDELNAKGVYPDADGQYQWEPGKAPLRWRPSIHMPRWASRITLEIVSVRVERLNEISEADAIAEGLIPVEYKGQSWAFDNSGNSYGSPTGAFRALWESINGDGSWQQNPWVWVVEFKRVEGR